MPAELPGIGSATEQTFQRVQEQYPLPNTRKDVIKAVEAILGKGGVQKLVIQLGQPIRIERLVRSGEAMPEMELVDEDLFLAARQAEIKDFAVEETSERVLMKAFREARKYKALPRAIIVNRREYLARWLTIPMEETDEVYGLQVVEHKDVPEDVLLFVCMKAEDHELIGLSLKILMEE